MPVSSRPTEPLALMFGEDGSLPNNPRLPLLVYRGAIDLSLGPSAERVVESTFGANGWGDMWRNGIFPYVHYHSMIHEALGIARGRAKVRFGGAAGKILRLAPGDVPVAPAGPRPPRPGATPGLCFSAAYPRRGSYDLGRGGRAEHAKALEPTPQVPLPDSDPVYSTAGPLTPLGGGATVPL